MARHRNHAGVSVQVVRQCLQTLRQGPAASPSPGRVVGIHDRPKRGAVLGLDDVEGTHHIAGRVTDSQPAEVDDAGQSSIHREEIGAHQITVHPDVRPRPRRCFDSRLPTRR